MHQSNFMGPKRDYGVVPETSSYWILLRRWSISYVPAILRSTFFLLFFLSVGSGKHSEILLLVGHIPEKKK